MKKWVLPILLLVVSLSLVVWAFSPLFITYAQVMPFDIHYEIGNKESIESAIIQAEHNAINYLREILGDSIFVLSILSIFNAVIAMIFIVRSNKKISGTAGIV